MGRSLVGPLNNIIDMEIKFKFMVDCNAKISDILHVIMFQRGDDLHLQMQGVIEFLRDDIIDSCFTRGFMSDCNMINSCLIQYIFKLFVGSSMLHVNDDWLT